VYDTCPNTTAQIDYAIPWFSPIYPSATSEYYNACDVSNAVGVPINGWGACFQYARTGNAYSGIGVYTSNSSNYREYIETKLVQPMIAGNEYCVEFYINKPGVWQFAIDAIGAYISTDSVLTSTFPFLLVLPTQVNNPTNNIIADTVNWVKISGSFIASGSEQFITIGNFKDDANTNVQYMGGPLPGAAYYFIDDVSVYPCDAQVFVADAGSNQTICVGKTDSVQLGSTGQNEYIYWWTPTTGLSNANIANPKASPAVTTTYYLHQKDFKFDETIDSVTVFVKTNCDTASVDDIFVPTAFSPNGDLNNDVLYVRSHNIKDMKFCIYNRWGEKVFESKDLNVGWDGTYKNDACNTGVYVWYLSATLKDGNLLTKKGDVTLFR